MGGGYIQPALARKTKTTALLYSPTSSISCSPFLLLSVSYHSVSATFNPHSHPSLFQSALYQICPVPCNPDPSLQLLHKLPVTAIQAVLLLFSPPCVYGSLSIQGQPLMRLPQRPIDERLSVIEDDPCQEHPELCISCPRLSLHTKTSTVDRDLKRHREGERKGGKRAETHNFGNMW